MNIKLGLGIGSSGAGALLVIALTVNGELVTIDGQPVIVPDGYSLLYDQNGLPLYTVENGTTKILFVENTNA